VTDPIGVQSPDDNKGTGTMPSHVIHLRAGKEGEKPRDYGKNLRIFKVVGPPPAAHYPFFLPNQSMLNLRSGIPRF